MISHLSVETKNVNTKLNDQSNDKSNISLFSSILDKAKKLLIYFSIQNGKEQVHNVELVF